MTVLDGRAPRSDDVRSVELSLTLAETNLILEALGNLPFVRVFQLIGKIQQQAEGQMSGGPQVTPTRPIGE